MESTEVLSLNLNEFNEYFLEVKEHIGGWRLKYQFPNGYGASIVYNNISYGLECAVLKDGYLCYDTPITNDVLGYLTVAELVKALHNIKEL